MQKYRKDFQASLYVPKPSCRWIGYAKLPRIWMWVWIGVYMVPCDGRDLGHTQCSQEKLWICSDPDQDKAVSKAELWMIIFLIHHHSELFLWQK